jgi:hypothetical protein
MGIWFLFFFFFGLADLCCSNESNLLFHFCRRFLRCLVYHPAASQNNRTRSTQSLDYRELFFNPVSLKLSRIRDVCANRK